MRFWSAEHRIRIRAESEGIRTRSRNIFCGILGTQDTLDQCCQMVDFLAKNFKKGPKKYPLQ
jgi:hypothetical protein